MVVSFGFFRISMLDCEESEVRVLKVEDWVVIKIFEVIRRRRVDSFLIC